MLAQSLNARNKPQFQMKPNTPQGLLDAAAMATSPVPFVGDAVGLLADSNRFVNEPESRTPLNFGLAALGLLPFLPSMGAAAGLFKGSAGPAMGGNQLGIVNPTLAKNLSIPKSLPSGEVFDAAVANTKGARVTEDGLLMNLQRNQNPNQAMAESVRGGVFYLPEGAAQAKHYSTGKNGYGGTEKITGEALITNPLFAKGGTGGKAPESAYDQLIGKGAYKSMREDALRVRHPDLIKERGDSLRGAISPEDFLAKYAPDLEGIGDYIFRNSRQGNQLAYALQEAAVGSAVRRAGHDSVLGYSKGKIGPFLSEVFDVRESHYPDAFGNTKVWPQLIK
jgi:hypothetical protein